MKFYLMIALALAAIVSATANLHDDFREIGDLIPKTKVGLIITKHLLFDGEVKKFKKFLKTPEFSKTWDTLIHNNEFRDAIQYAQDSGCDVIGGLNALANYLNLSQYPNMFRSDQDIIPRTVMSLFDEIVGALPRDKIGNLMKNKMQTSSEFKRFHDRLASDEFHNLVMAVRVRF